jgi:hypothetical protein
MMNFYVIFKKIIEGRERIDGQGLSFLMVEIVIWIIEY